MVGLYSQAHPHNLWLVFPGSILKYLSMNILILLQYVACLGFGLYVMRQHQGSALSWMGACLASGILGQLLLYEVTESNHLQFGMASSVFLAVLLVPKMTGRWRVLWAVLLVIGCGVFIKSSIMNVVRVTQVESVQEEPYFVSHALLDAYTWLGEQDLEGVVVFSRHYERLNTHAFPKDSFIRSAVSGQQMYLEHIKYKGLVMQDDYPERFANVLALYRHYVVLSERSKQALAVFETVRDYDDSVFESSYSLGKAWYYSNREAYVVNTLPSLVSARGGDEVWLRRFVAEHNIEVMVLEWGDQPSELLLRLFSVVYSTDGVTVLRLRS